MENQNQNPTPDQNQAQALQAYLELQRQKRRKFLWGAFAGVLVLILAYFGWKNAGLLRATIIEAVAPVPGTQALFIPNYEASAGDQGQIFLQARAGAGIPANIQAVSFTLHYEPANALIFNENSLVFDGDTPLVDDMAFDSAQFQTVNTSVPGQVGVSIILPTPSLVDAGDRLAGLEVQINPAVAEGTPIALTIDGVQVVVADPAAPAGIRVSTNLTDIDAGTITLVTQNNLRLLYAESLDNTHILLHFSDFLTQVSMPGNYTIAPALPVTLAERGDAQGHGQDTVLLTTAAQAPGTRYWVEISDAGLIEVNSNSQGGVNANYRRAVFFGPGSPAASLSDFRVVSARVTGAHTMEVSFSHPVAPASATEGAFRITIPPALDALTITDATASGSTVTLTTDELLMQRSGYLVTALAGIAQPVRRASDGALPGINQAVFRGFSNGPQVQSVVFTPDPASTEAVPLPPFLDITFDAPITPGPAGALGRIHTTGTTDDLLEVDADDPGVTVTAARLRITGFPTDPMANYTYVADPAVASGGVPVDNAHNSITFWGDGHDATLNTVGTASVFRRNVIEIQSGSLNFAGLTPLEVQLFSYTDPDILVPAPADPTLVAGITIVSGRLRVTSIGDLLFGRHYILSFSDGATLLQTAEAVVAEDFEIVSASATGPTEVTVTFSENVDQATLVPAAFILNAGVPAVTGINVAPNFRDVRLTLDVPTVAGTVYQLNAEEVRSFNGGKPLMLNTTVFSGYQTQTIAGDVRIDQVRSTSTTQLEVTFSGPLTPASVTPVNMSMIFGTTPDDFLTITSVAPVSGNTFRLTTSAQVADRNYFVIPMNAAQTSGVRDSLNRFLNTQRVLNVFGFIVPQSRVTSFIPSTFTNEEERLITVTGQNLDTITTARVGTTPVTITGQSATGFTFILPAGFAAGGYNVTLINAAGEAQTLPNALLVTEPVRPFRIISDASRATPFQVPNDGTTRTTLWVLVEDPVDLANVDSVTIDLTLIGGAPSVEMTKATGIQPQNRQWYRYEISIPATVATSSTPTQLPAQARKGSEVVSGFASVHVTRNVAVSVAPTIDQAFFLPASVAPDGTTEVKISAQVSDPDGADTIQSVVANLGPVGVGFVPLTSVTGVGSAAETVSRFYESVAFNIPSTTRTGTYPITLTAQDATGEASTIQIQLSVSSDLSGPRIVSERSYISPRSSVPNDGTTFSLHVFVEDPDGMGDISSVIASFGNLGLPPATLTRAAGVTDAARSAYFTVEGLAIPRTISMGVRQILITATDNAGATANLTLQIDVTFEDTLGEPPLILVDRAYTTPRVAVNDGQTPLTLHVFVRDNDNDIESVLVNLDNVGQVGPQGTSELRQAGAAASLGSSVSTSSSLTASASPCPTNSRTLVCLEPSVREGNEGQWFILPDITISSDIAPASEPYNVEVIAADLTGKTTRQPIPIHVGNQARLATDAAPPRILGAVPTSASAVEVIFSEEMDATSIPSSGLPFTITSSADIADRLLILGATINAAGTVVTLTTEAQQQGKEYVLTGSADLRDAVGVPMAVGSASRASFTGFTLSDRPPVVEFIAATDAGKIEIEFRDPVRPSSVNLNRIEIQESGGTEDLDILGLQFVEPNVLELQTEPQKAGQRYRVRIEGITSASGTPPPAAINKLIKGFKASDVARAGLSRTADLNGDGRVDFTDFTMFSAVYGTSFLNPEASDSADQTPSAGQPIAPQPDATIPRTTPTTSPTVTSPNR